MQQRLEIAMVMSPSSRLVKASSMGLCGWDAELISTAVHDMAARIG
jgi:hypothetical protein